MEWIARKSIFSMIIVSKRNINTKSYTKWASFWNDKISRVFCDAVFSKFPAFLSAKNNAHLSYHTLFEMMWALYNLSYMIRKMTVFSIVSRGPQIVSSFQIENIFIISKRASVHHIERTAHPSFRRDRAQSFQNDSFAYNKSGINQQ